MGSRKQFYLTLILITGGNLLLLEVLARLVHLLIVG